MDRSRLGKIVRNRAAITLVLCCLIPLALFAALSAKGDLGSWRYYALFLCPILHVFMMRGHQHAPPGNLGGDSSRSSPSPQVEVKGRKTSRVLRPFPGRGRP